VENQEGKGTTFYVALPRDCPYMDTA
jgi:signal transduction histidine kinase